MYLFVMYLWIYIFIITLFKIILNKAIINIKVKKVQKNTSRTVVFKKIKDYLFTKHNKRWIC